MLWRRISAVVGTRPRWLANIVTRLCVVASLIVSSVGPLVPPIARADEVQRDEAIVVDGVSVGWHYRQTGGDTGNGFDVVVPFYDRMRALGGRDVTGYPLSAPFLATDGCTYQAFQRIVLQQCPNAPVVLANTFQILEDAGANGFLVPLGIGPGQDDKSASLTDAIRVRLTWLEDQELADRFLGYCGDDNVTNAWQLCGLPMNTPKLYNGLFVSQRFQRIAFQRWVVDGPAGIKAGDITPVNGGELLKQAGILVGPSVVPHAIGKPPAIGAPISLLSQDAPSVASPPSVAPVAPAPAPAPAPQAVAPTPTKVAAPAAVVPTYPLAPIPGFTLPAGRSLPLHFGFQGDFFNPQVRTRGVEAIRQAGLQWAKQQVVWSQYEISPAECAKEPANCFNVQVDGRSHAYKVNQFSYLDAVIADLVNGNLNILVSVVRSPDHLAVQGGHSPSDPTNLRDFLQVLVTRYKGKIKAVEPWNEQNLAGEWGSTRLWPNAPASPPQGVVDFVALMKAAYTGIKTADPNVIVVLPALTPTGVGECWLNPDVRASSGCIDQVRIAIDDRLYLDLLYQVNQAEVTRYYDVVGVHPSGYNNPPDDTPDKKTVSSSGFKGHPSFYPRRFQQLREVQQKYGDNKPMWFTEVGWSVTRLAVPGYEYGTENSEAQRAKYMARLMELVYTETPYVTNIIFWNLNFRQIVPETDEKYGFGVLERDGATTASYGCVADFVKSGGKITQAGCR